MYRNWFHHFRGVPYFLGASPHMILQHPANGQIVVATKFGDVTGDGFMDTVYLTATKESDSAFLRNITLHIRNGRTHRVESFSLQENTGYEPAIWLGDFTGDGFSDIFITIQSGGSGGVIYGYVFTSISGKITEIFNSIKFSERHPYKVNYANNYKVSVTSENPHKRYTLDLMYKGKEYLDEIYNADGTLKQTIEGWVDPASAIYPINFGNHSVYYLLTNEAIAGRYHADGLGFVENLLHWENNEFKVVRQTVSIYGENL